MPSAGGSAAPSSPPDPGPPPAGRGNSLPRRGIEGPTPTGPGAVARPRRTERLENRRRAATARTTEVHSFRRRSRCPAAPARSAFSSCSRSRPPPHPRQPPGVPARPSRPRSPRPPPPPAPTAASARSSAACDARDLGIALAVARLTRGLTGDGFGRLHLLGWSRGGQIGYAYLDGETRLPPHLRQVRDVSTLLVDLQPPEARLFDFGHGDLFQAGDAEELVWEGILEWLEGH